MITLVELDKKIVDFLNEDNKDYPNELARLIKEWTKMKKRLEPHEEYGEIVSFAETADSFLADLCWRFGCDSWYHINWWGDESWTISLPSTEDDYLENLDAGGKFWSENYED